MADVVPVELSRLAAPTEGRADSPIYRGADDLGCDRNVETVSLHDYTAA